MSLGHLGIVLKTGLDAAPLIKTIWNQLLIFLEPLLIFLMYTLQSPTVPTVEMHKENLMETHLS